MGNAHLAAKLNAIMNSAHVDAVCDMSDNFQILGKGPERIPPNLWQLIVFILFLSGCFQKHPETP